MASRRASQARSLNAAPGRRGRPGRRARRDPRRSRCPAGDRGRPPWRASRFRDSAPRSCRHDYPEVVGRAAGHAEGGHPASEECFEGGLVEQRAVSWRRRSCWLTLRPWPRTAAGIPGRRDRRCRRRGCRPARGGWSPSACRRTGTPARPGKTGGCTAHTRRARPPRSPPRRRLLSRRPRLFKPITVAVRCPGRTEHSFGGDRRVCEECAATNRSLSEAAGSSRIPAQASRWDVRNRKLMSQKASKASCRRAEGRCEAGRSSSRPGRKCPRESPA